MRMRLPKIITRRRLKWTGLAATVLFAAAMVASYWYWPSYTRSRASSRVLLQAGVAPGGIYVAPWKETNVLFTSLFTDWCLETRSAVKDKPISVVNRPPRNDHSFGWLPRYRWERTLGSGFYFLFIPFWIPLVLVALPTGILFYRDRKPKVGCCAKCRYDLAGLSGDTCPECGTKIATNDSHKAPASAAEGEGGVT